MQKKQTTKKRTSRPKQKEQNLRNEIIGFIILFVGLFFIYGYFASESGAVGAFFSRALTITMGRAGALIFSIVMIIHAILLLVKFTPFIQYRGSLWLYIFALNLMTVVSFGQNELFSETGLFNIEFYRMVWQTETLGGIIGQFLSKLYIGLFSNVGAWLFVILITIISFILIFRKGFIDFIKLRAEQRKKNKQKKTKEKAKKDDVVVRISQEDNQLYVKTNKKNSLGKKNHLDEFTNAITEPADEKQKQMPRINPMKDFIADHEDGAQSVELNSSDKDLYIKESSENSNHHQASTMEESVEMQEQIKASQSKKKPSSYVFPSVSLLDNVRGQNTAAEKQEILANAALLEKTLSDFGVDSKVSEINMGPTVTRYELQLQPGIRVSKVVNLSDDIAMSLAAQRVRIEAPIPGKSAIGIEVPNKEIAVVKLSHTINTPEFKKHQSPLAIALGKDLSGQNIVMDITRLPHLLIAGATGSGKSVCINTIIMSILYHASPDDVKMILIDPKMVELNVYNEIPHLLIPVVTDPKLASGALNWAVREMTNRYEQFAENKVRDIEGYNAKMKSEGQEKFPHIVLIIDELSDLMMVSAQQVENAICRLAQLARAAGIHLVLATQRPSVNVITGLIKANIPSRISFAVTSQVDSRTILDMGGAEKLLGRGDMLYFPSGLSKPIRAQCAFVSEKEVERVVGFVKGKQTADYDDEVFEKIKTGNDDSSYSSSSSGFEDDLLPNAMEIAFENGKISTSNIQRKLRIGYARAGRIVDEMEERGYISGPNGSKPREVLISYEEYLEQKNNLS